MGFLNIAFETGAITESAPLAWQEIYGQRGVGFAGLPLQDLSVSVHGKPAGRALGYWFVKFSRRWGEGSVL